MVVLTIASGCRLYAHNKAICIYREQLVGAISSKRSLSALSKLKLDAFRRFLCKLEVAPTGLYTKETWVGITFTILSPSVNLEILQIPV